MDEPLRVLFMGSPDFAVPSLRVLASRHQVVAVVTQPDRPRGRGRALAAPPVKHAARALDLPLLQPPRIRGRALREQLMSYRPDAIVVAAYGEILGPRLLSAPPLGCINVHASLLPRYRGAAPIQWAILRGERSTGVTIMQMEPGLDTGPILLAAAIEIRGDETAASLHDRLAPLGASLLLRALDGLREGELEPSPQDDAMATYAPMIGKEDACIDFTRPAEEVDRWVRGLDPWPGAFTTLGDVRLKLFRSTPAEGQGPSGTVLATDERGLLVACGQGAVWISELQLPGRRRMPAVALLAGHPIAPGTLLGDPQSSGRG